MGPMRRSQAGFMGSKDCRYRTKAAPAATKTRPIAGNHHCRYPAAPRSKTASYGTFSATTWLSVIVCLTRRISRGAPCATSAACVCSAPGGHGKKTLVSRHRITWSARSSSDGGIVRPRAWAVLVLITSSSFVGCSMGSSPGFAPLKILSAKLAARRYWSG
jgi:hypothetical protein